MWKWETFQNHICLPGDPEECVKVHSSSDLHLGIYCNIIWHCILHTFSHTIFDILEGTYFQTVFGIWSNILWVSQANILFNILFGTLLAMHTCRISMWFQSGILYDLSTCFYILAFCLAVWHVIWRILFAILCIWTFHLAVRVTQGLPGEIFTRCGTHSERETSIHTTEILGDPQNNRRNSHPNIQFAVKWSIAIQFLGEILV